MTTSKRLHDTLKVPLLHPQNEFRTPRSHFIALSMCLTTQSKWPSNTWKRPHGVPRTPLQDPQCDFWTPRRYFIAPSKHLHCTLKVTFKHLEATLHCTLNVLEHTLKVTSEHLAWNRRYSTLKAPIQHLQSYFRTPPSYFITPSKRLHSILKALSTSSNWLSNTSRRLYSTLIIILEHFEMTP